MLDEAGNPLAKCFFWDMKNADKVPDYITCRYFFLDSANKLCIQDQPGIYAVDLIGNAHGDMNKFIKFTDLDVDGDICDQEFVLLLESPATNETPK